MKTKLPGGIPDKALAAELRERLRGLTPHQAERMRMVMRLHAAGDHSMAYYWLLEVAEQAPEHPEVLLWQGLRHLEAGQWAQAAQMLARSAAQRPRAVRVWCMLATAQSQVGDLDAAAASLARAADGAGTAGDWLKISLEADRIGLYEESLSAAHAVLQRDPQSAVARLQRARCHKALGASSAAAADLRMLIAAGRELPRAWFSLVDLKTEPLTAAELRQLETAGARSGWPPEERLLLDFALGKALEDAGRHGEALQAIDRANASVRAAAPWDATKFARRVEEIRCAQIDAVAGDMGREVIFIVGMPRSGSTLVEQVLAAHPSVEGASELPHLAQVLDAESRRRGRPFPAWAPAATAADWNRLGQEYLRQTARWRRDKPIATDKLPDNWMYVGAIRAMLPGARVLHCRRDALETCWSCYKQLFGPGHSVYSYDYDSLAQYSSACEHLGDVWAQRHATAVRIQIYEALVQAPDAQIRELLAFCGLPFDPACLNFQGTRRAIRTPSALQVRQPMAQISRPAAGYGALLDPLRRALAQAESH